MIHRFDESVDLILDDTGQGSKSNITEKILTLISDPFDEGRLLTLLNSKIRDTIRMGKNNNYIGRTIHCLFRGGSIFTGNELLYTSSYSTTK